MILPLMKKQTEIVKKDLVVSVNKITEIDSLLLCRELMDKKRLSVSFLFWNTI